MAYLVIRSEHREVHRGELRDAVILGRAPECDVQLLDPLVSRMHCRVERDGDDWVVIDLGSANGTFVHGEKIERHVLADGEAFHLGDERVIFHNDEFMPPRPARPDEVDLRHSDSTIWPSSAVSHVDGTLAAAKVTVGTPRGARSDAKSHESTIATPLAFTRPPAAPKVQEQAVEPDAPPKPVHQPRGPMPRQNKLAMITALALLAIVLGFLGWYLFIP